MALNITSMQQLKYVPTPSGSHVEGINETVPESYYYYQSCILCIFISMHDYNYYI